MLISCSLDHETAASAVRNLNGTEVKGRPLRIDLADSDPSLEGKTTYRGELEGGDSKALSIPPGAPVPAGMTPLDVISNVLGTVRPAQLMEVMGHMKVGTFISLGYLHFQPLSRCS